MSKGTVVGAGNVGATCANVLAFNEVADEVVLLEDVYKRQIHRTTDTRDKSFCVVEQF